MQIEKLVVGVLQENCYIVTKNNKTIIIDPGYDAKKIIDKCSGKEVVEVLITHHHFDHVGALEEIENHFNIKENQRSKFFNYEVIKTPGHTSDSVCFYFEDDKVLFSGDFIFKDTIGATHFPTGSILEMQQSLKLISAYPDDVVVYPGHGDKTYLGEEKKYFNRYF